MGPLTPQDVMSIATLDELRQIAPEQLDHDISEAEFRHILGLCDALWMHDGDPAKPHAKLTSGACSDGYVNCSQALRLPTVGAIMGRQATRALREVYGGPVDWVVGSAYASILFSYEVARQLGAEHGYTEKAVIDGQEAQTFKRFEIPEGAVVLDAEELMTTSTTAQRVLEGVNRDNPHQVEWGAPLLVLVHRSDVLEFDNRPVAYAYHLDIKTFLPADCPLCRQGSEPLPPKANWAELMGRAA